MTIKHCLYVLRARIWLVLLLALVIGGAGVGWVAFQKPSYTATASVMLDVRGDPSLGQVAPSFGSNATLTTQTEVIRSDGVIEQVVRALKLSADPAELDIWRTATGEKVPFERFAAERLRKGLEVEPLQGSAVLNIRYSDSDPARAQATANAFAEAYMQRAVDLRVQPARQSATFLEEQTKTLRQSLLDAQERLSKFQKSKGIVTTDERVDQETARYNALVTQLTLAETERVDTSARQRNTGSMSSPDVIGSPAVTGLRAQLATAQTRLSEISSVVGRNHPQRLQLEAQINELQQQITAEVQRVSAGTTTVDRGTSQKVAALRALVEQQKQLLLSLRESRDQVQTYVRDVDSAQRAYDQVAQRLGQFQLAEQNTQPDTRLLNAATLPITPTSARRLHGALIALALGLAIGIGIALGLEWLNPRVRMVEDLTVVAGVPVIGVLHPVGSRRPVFRRALLRSSGSTPHLGPGNLRLRP